MECPACFSRLSRVLETKQHTLRLRNGAERVITRERRQCIHCGTVFWARREESE